jgi:hypothetical protein
MAASLAGHPFLSPDDIASDEPLVRETCPGAAPTHASQRPSRHHRHRPQLEIPIAADCAPRVPSSGTFVRLPAPQTLHDSGQSGLGAEDRIAAVKLRLTSTAALRLHARTRFAPCAHKPVSGHNVVCVLIGRVWIACLRPSLRDECEGRQGERTDERVIFQPRHRRSTAYHTSPTSREPTRGAQNSHLNRPYAVQYRICP